MSIDHGLQVFGDPDLLFQAFSNLIDNALKYTAAEGKVIVSASLENSNLKISVCDNGLGVAKDDLNRVTERFYRGTASAGHEGEVLHRILPDGRGRLLCDGAAAQLARFLGGMHSRHGRTERFAHVLRFHAGRYHVE